MEISAINPHYVSATQTVGQKKNTSSAPPTSYSNKISDISKNSHLMHKLASQYDVRNISPPEMRKLGKELYDNGSIGLTELGILTLVPIDVVKSGNRVIDAHPVESTEQKYDYIKDIEGALALAKSRGEKGYEFLESTLSVLNMLDIAKNGSVNFMA